MTPEILDDDEFERRITVEQALATMELALSASVACHLHSPPRSSVSGITFTVGRLDSTSSIAGFRAYLTDEPPEGDQLTAVWDAVTARLLILHVGSRLGVWRTGSMGGTAIARMAPPHARTLGVLGSGTQAFMQARAALGARDLERVLVYSRTPDHRERFVDRLSGVVEVPVEALESAQDVVQQSDVLVTATASASPVLESGWLRPEVHINHVGPKRRGASELPAEVYERATLVATDAPAQLEAFGSAAISASVLGAGRVASLGDLRSQERPRGMSVFVSQGLAGTEVMLLESVLGRP